MMKRIGVALAVLALLLTTSGVAASASRVEARLTSVGGSGVHGFVRLQQLEGGGTRINVQVEGLSREITYAAFYYDNAESSTGPDLLATFKANRAGVGHAEGEADEDLDEIGSVSVRIGPGYGKLLACAVVHR